MLVERYVEAFAQYRSPSGVIGMTVIEVVVALLPAVPGAKELLGVGLRASVPLALGHLLINVTAAAIHRRWGPLSRPHRIAEATETLYSSCLSAAFVYASGSARSIFWIFLVALAALLATSLFTRRYDRWMLLVPQAVLAGAFFAFGKPLDGALTLLASGLIVYMYWTATSVGLRGVAAQAELTLVREAMAAAAVEDERRRIARELHDGVGAELSALLRQARASRSEAASSAELVRRASASLEELRVVVWALRKPARPLAEVVEYLAVKVRDQCSTAGRRAVVRLEGDGASVISSASQSLLLNVTQELVRNAVDHATASQVEVVIRLGETLTLFVDDDGCGIPLDAVERSSGGLADARERAEGLGGTLQIERVPHGSRVVVTLPWAAITREAPPDRGVEA